MKTNMVVYRIWRKLNKKMKIVAYPNKISAVIYWKGKNHSQTVFITQIFQVEAKLKYIIKDDACQKCNIISVEQ